MRTVGARRLVVCSLALLVGGAQFARATPAGTAMPPPAGHASLAGAWQLNDGLSDDAGAKLREALRRHESPDRAEPPTPGGGGRAGSGGRRGAGGGRGGAAAGAGRRDAGTATASGEEALTISEFLTAPAHLQITEAAGEITLAGAPAAGARIDPRGKWMRGEDGRQFRARWKDGALVTEVRCDGGPKATTTYRALVEEGRLEVVSRLDLALGGSVRVRRVYDAAKTR